MSRFCFFLRPLSTTLLAVLLFIGSMSVCTLTPTRASGPADIATVLPIEPTDEPQPTEAPQPTDPLPAPTDQPQPTAEPQPTEEPTATEEPQPTDAPQATPTDTSRPRQHDTPSPTPVLPTSTAIPPTATPVPTTNIRIHKVVNVEAASVGDTVVYTIVVENTGTSPAADVVLTDVVPASIEVIDLHSSKGDIVISGQQVTAYPSLLQPGEQASYTITGRVRTSAAPGSTVENTATITTSTPGDDPGDNTSTVTFRIPVPPAATPPMPTAQTTITFRVPRTADGDDNGLVWDLLPWVLLGVLVIGVGGLLAWSIASTRGLTQQMLLFMAPRALTSAGDASIAASVPEVANTEDVSGTPPQPLASVRMPATALRTSNTPRTDLPPLGAPFGVPAPAGPLPPPVALDRESVLRTKEDR